MQILGRSGSRLRSKQKHGLTLSRETVPVL